MESQLRYSLITLGFDVSRRCNMACNFCSRGKPEEADLGYDIIDKTLDQIQRKNVYVSSVRLGGGEPFLTPGVISYIVDGIIRRRLRVGEMCVFTNGSIRNPVIRDALIRTADYLASNPDLVKRPKEIRNLITPKYDGICDGTVDVIISEDGHPQFEGKDQTIEYYSGKRPNINVSLQSVSTHNQTGTHGLILQGRAVENIETLIGDKLLPNTLIKGNDNRYCFMEHIGDMIWFYKSVTVSTNGNVFIGCLRPFYRVDHESDFNIADGDLFTYLESYCWSHPITSRMNFIRETKQAYDICRKHGIDLSEQDTLVRLYDAVDIMISMYERICKQLHEKYLRFSPQHIMLMGAIILIEQLKDVHKDYPAEKITRLLFDETYSPYIIGKLITPHGRQQLINEIENDLAPWER